jgi:hypothetical protein
MNDKWYKPNIVWKEENHKTSTKTEVATCRLWSVNHANAMSGMKEWKKTDSQAIQQICTEFLLKIMLPYQLIRLCDVKIIIHNAKREWVEKVMVFYLLFSIYIHKSKSMFVGIFVRMYTINSLTT